jgi:hypothetical protein
VRFDSGLSDHCASPSYPRASNAADGRPFFARGPDGSCVRHGTQRSPSSDLPTGHLVRTATAFGRSHSHPPRPGHRHSVRVLLSSPEAPPALRTSSSSHCRKEQQRQRKEEEPRKILPPPTSLLIPYRPTISPCLTRNSSGVNRIFFPAPVRRGGTPVRCCSKRPLLFARRRVLATQTL